MTNATDKLKRIVELMTLERSKIGKQVQEQYNRKHELQKELFDKSIPHNRYINAKEMLDITIDMISDLTLEASVWEQAREIVLNVADEP